MNRFVETIACFALSHFVKHQICKIFLSLYFNPNEVRLDEEVQREGQLHSEVKSEDKKEELFKM